MLASPRPSTTRCSSSCGSVRNPGPVVTRLRPPTPRWRPRSGGGWLSGLTAIASVSAITINTPGVVVDGHRRDPGHRGRVLTSVTMTGGAGDVRAFGRRVRRCCAGRGGVRPRSRGSDPLGVLVMRRPWLVALAATAFRFDAGRAGVLDGPGQQHAAAVPGGTRDPRRRGAAARRWAPGALGPVRVLVAFP